MKTVTILFPNQLFEDTPALKNGRPVFLVEEYLFFLQYNFHKQKLAFHRATMRAYADFLKGRGFQVHYVECRDIRADVRKLIHSLGNEVREVHFVDPTDDWLGRRLKKGLEKNGIQGIEHPSHLFLNSREDLGKFFRSGKKSFLQAEFYRQQRIERSILVTGEKKPVGGKWSFDAENRKKYPVGEKGPEIDFPEKNSYWEEACLYVGERFPGNPGSLEDYYYPVDFKGAQRWFKQFLDKRFADFGQYEDAIVQEEMMLHHSLLTPLLNTGLLTPEVVVEAALKKYESGDIPINSMEGFIRQVIGWREFIRGVYESVGREERTTNFWNFTREMPRSFYDGTTGILPIDDTIRKVLKSGYCHHIERLMILGNFMLLCEIRPGAVYRWFMELFIDSYDWVMVPNVYGMSQFADGGLMATKPYLSGSNYIRKMSNYAGGKWQEVWDGLFWRFLHVHRDFFSTNPRLGMLLGTLDRMADSRRNALLETAEEFLGQLR